jgi:hypothetical protein
MSLLITTILAVQDDVLASLLSPPALSHHSLSHTMPFAATTINATFNVLSNVHIDIKNPPYKLIILTMGLAYAIPNIFFK